jgi:hypothetical protein
VKLTLSGPVEAENDLSYFNVLCLSKDFILVTCAGLLDNRSCNINRYLENPIFLFYQSNR